MSPKVQPLTSDFLEEEVTVRGVTYRLRELSIGDYDELVRKATVRQTNALTGEDTESIDNSLLLKLMVLKSVVDPHLTPETHAGLPMRVVLKLNQTVNRMHFGDEPETPKKDKTEDEAEEGTAKGND